MRRALVVAVVLAQVAAVQAVASAWTQTGSGAGSLRARTMPAGNTPTASVTGRDVTVNWAPSTFPDGRGVAGYRVARYDAATGSPQAVGPGCSGTVTGTSCTETSVPPGTWRYAVTPLQGAWVGAESAPSAPVVVLGPTDTEPPTVGASVVGKAQGVPGFIRPGGAYHVDANVTDAGTPPSGLASVTADVSSITAGRTAVALASGSFSIGGVTYTHRSDPVTADGALPAGSPTYSVTATDGAGNARTRTGFSVVVDATPPAAADVRTTNVAGGTAGKAETGDTVVLTYSEAIVPNAIVAGWAGGGHPRHAATRERDRRGAGLRADLERRERGAAAARIR